MPPARYRAETLQPRVVQHRGRQQAALQPGVLLCAEPRDVQLPLGLVPAAALHRVPDHPVQQLPGDVALDQVILRPGPDRFLAQVLVGHTGQHDDGDVRLLPEQPPQAVQAL